MKAQHVHAKLIKQWADDPTLEIQFRRGWLGCDTDWCRAPTPAWDPVLEYRVKPLDLIESCWYPVIDHNGDSCVVIYIDGTFYYDIAKEPATPLGGHNPLKMRWIGSPMYINFPEVA